MQSCCLAGFAFDSKSLNCSCFMPELFEESQIIDIIIQRDTNLFESFPSQSTAVYTKYYTHVKASPTSCLMMSGIENGIHPGPSTGTSTILLIAASRLTKYGKECMQASQSRPYCETGRPAANRKSAMLNVTQGSLTQEEEFS
jgi:hypothetical protein